MRVLLVTGKLAERAVREAASRVRGAEVEVKVLDYPVAALMTAKYVAEKLKGVDGNFDYIVVPGLVFGDVSVVERSTGVRTVKGSQDAYDIPVVIEALKRGLPLSSLEPADAVIARIRLSDLRKEIAEMENSAEYAFEQDGLKIPISPPPFRIFLELDVKWDEERVKREALRVRDYVDVVVVGTPAGSDDPDSLSRKVKTLVDLGFRVGVDSASPNELKAGVRAGAGFVFKP